ncbi:P-loop containing nucleoside triphosphate hydrolase protein [Polyporus arcularius HHB13444]|uniref:P-loop containing nucleoside triphosphate hydrolase protein n=1 Tax=Polyporus arcularius HHB13444 TaxID=1314778 RepID=A0A5C3PDH4_9APHY|nr:P-loop containing nucleoside triphosphate hydrolase protein [Polyporus arcularius HHB13444]
MDDISLVEAQPDTHRPLRRPSSLDEPPSYVLYDTLSFISVVALLVLSVVTLVLETRFGQESRAIVLTFYAFQSAAFTYAAVLVASSSRWTARAHCSARSVAVQKCSILLLLWVVYIYRDVWPLATDGRSPADEREGLLLWVKVVLLTFAAVILPLISPRRPAFGVPVWDATLRAEQTASILSLVTYSWMNPFIKFSAKLHAIKDKLEQDQLPHLPVERTVEHMIDASYKYVDPIEAEASGDKRQKWNVAWGLLWVFRWEEALMGAMVALGSFASFLAPLSIRHILAYIESGPDREAVRPWVWIAALLLGSMTVSLAMQFYHYVSTTVVMRTQAVLTQLMYDHSLRMRANCSKPRSAGKPKPREAVSIAKLIAGAFDRVMSYVPGTAQAKRAQPEETYEDMPAINNLVTTDLKTVTDASTFLWLVFLETPLQIALSLYFLYQILGWSTFVGVSVMVVLLPFADWLNDLARKYGKEKKQQSDQRVTLVIQMLKNIRTVKLHGWEPEQASRVEAKRAEELKRTRKINMTQIWMNFIKTFIPLLVMLASYATYTLVMKRELSASVVFSSISLFEILRSQLGFLLFRIPILIDGKVSLDRINRLFRESELLDLYSTPDQERPTPYMDNQAQDIVIRDARFTWTDSGATAGMCCTEEFSLSITEEVRFKGAGLHLIYGPTACGKTSLLMALLGEMHYKPLGQDSVFYGPRDRVGGIAYVAQEPWILQETVRSNILFGTPFDEDRYKKTLYACALGPDLAGWSKSDLTEVGERGVTLSGGQKARIALARAVYSHCPTVFIDDVLAALDNSTVMHIVNQCLRGELLRGRTVLLVSNNVAVVRPHADHVYEMLPGGIIRPADIDMDKIDKCPAEDVVIGDAGSCASSTIVEDSTKVTSDADSAKGKDAAVDDWRDIMIAEDVLPASPRVASAFPSVQPKDTPRASSWLLVLRSMSSRPVLYWLVFLGALLLSNLVVNAQFWLLGYWAKQYSHGPVSTASVSWFLGIYSALLMAATISDFASRAMHMKGSLRACAAIHKKLMDSVLGTTLKRLEDTPTSQIIARCTGDIGAVDGQIVPSLFTLLDYSAFLAVRLVMVMVVAPIFIIGVAAVAIAGTACAKVYMAAQRPVKQEEASTRAPILGLLNTTLAGLVSVRAYGVQERFRKQMFERIDRWTRASNTFFNLNRWMTVRVDSMASLFTVSLAIYLTYFAKLDASNIGFSLSMAIAASTKVFEWVRTFNALDLAGVNLERIEEYLKFESEEDLMGSGEHGYSKELAEFESHTPDWPATGDLEVRDLIASYGNANGDPEVLKGLTFSVRSGQRIGIVGRTGSGKSTLTLALLRCIFTNLSPRLNSRFVKTGEVLYSGRSIGSLDLPVLRKNITIIPQNPELFAGDIRQNLDPFSQYAEAELTRALLSAQGLSENDPRARDGMKLDTRISGDGDLSAGERQIIALARAIVRKSKLLIMDEATSSIDHATDERIQSSLREHLDHDVTVLTVAHRLATICDYDKVMVLDSGRMVEFDAPGVLLSKEDSYFRRLVDDCPEQEREALYSAIRR